MQDVCYNEPMIQALILDIDGVMVGEKIGFNSPYPNSDVIRRLSSIRGKGIPIILCTAKPHYSITPIIKSAQLANPHITFAGGIVIDPLQNTIVESHPLPKQTATDVIATCLRHNFYTEVYTLSAYYVLRSQRSTLTDIHTHILQQEPMLVDALEPIAKKEHIYKILPVVPNESGIDTVNNALAPYRNTIDIAWSIHPIASPHQFCNVAPAGVSKGQATLHVLSHLGIDPANTLSVGDSTSDWKFMELTGSIATLENGQDPLKKLVTQRGSSGFIGGHVDANGILDIFDHFELPSSDTHP